jgi:lipoprotein-anchoring transpeptidase ErfK/SrfK
MAAPRRLLGRAAVLAAGALALSGCSLGQLGVHAGTVVQESVARISLSPAPTGKPVAPATALVVKVASGRLTDVVVSGPRGAVAGTLSVDGLVWTAESGTLDYASRYSIRASAVDRTGLPTAMSETIRTVAPTNFLSFAVTPSSSQVVGVGMPLRLDLDHRISNLSERAAVERNLTVTARGKPVVGGWRWQTDDVLVYRPQVFWPGNATVAVTASFKGVRFSSTLWGERDVTSSFRTGPAMVSYVDMRTDQLRVTRDGVTVRTIPITTGKPGFETRSGIKVIMSKERTRIMDAATGGTSKTDPEYYRLEVEYAMRVTNSGEFLHAAPWSVSHQGHTNVSHGCTGMSTGNAAWLYANSRPGDVVVYTGNDRGIEGGNGITVWNVSWPRWQKYSALSATT